MTKILSYIFVSGILSIPLILYKKLYFKRVSMISLVADGTVSVVALKPDKRHLSDFLGEDVSVCNLRAGYVAFYNRTDPAGSIRYHDQVSFPNCIVLAAVRRGRFSSVVVSDRVLSDILNSFTFHGGN